MSDTFAVGLRDSLFGHAAAVGNGDLGLVPEYIHFDRSEIQHPVTVFTDMDLDKVADDRGEVKVAWIVECQAVHPAIYKRISDPALYELFDVILTHDSELLALDKRFMFTAFGGCWILPDDRRIHEKTKNLSIIASAKRDFPGHELRHQIVDTYRSEIDGLFGRSYQELVNKIDGLKDYRYHIVVENDRKDFWFTEKLIDCFVTGTIPIYWGCPSIGTYFDMDGIIQFNSIEELTNILTSLSAADYQQRLPAIQNNFEASKQFTVTEDYMYNNVFKSHPLLKKYVEAQ